MFRKWGGLIVLGILFIGSWIGQFFFQMTEVANEAQTHGEVFDWASFWPQFLSATFENWQSEFLQLAVQAVIIGLLASKMFKAYADAQRDEMKQAVREVLTEREE